MNLSWMKVGDLIKLQHDARHCTYKILDIVRKAWDPYIVVEVQKNSIYTGTVFQFLISDLYFNRPEKVFINNYKRSRYEFKYSDNR